MCRACPIPSANTVAQNPDGNFSPLSSLGHPWLAAVTASPLAWFRSDTSELKTHKGTITAIKEISVLYRRSHPIEILQSERTNMTVATDAH
jgi:hypothetical protein